jgi:spore germination protein YaaH
MPRGVATKAIRQGGRLKETVAYEIKKPGRKTAVLHSMALGVISALVVTGAGLSSGQHQTTTDTPQQSVRRYLPAIQQDPKLSPLDTANAVTETGRKIGLYGWVTPWNRTAGINKAYASVSAFWLTVNADGSSFTPKAEWAEWQSFRSTQSPSESYLTVTGDPTATSLALSSIETQQNHIKELLRIVVEQQFDGVDIDYEGLGTANKELFTAYIRNLSTAFHQKGKKVAVTLEARLANAVPMDWQALGILSDEVRIMAYDYHAQTTATPGPISPLAWVAEIASYASDRIEAQKIVMGLGNYGYDWTAPANSAEPWTGRGISYAEAVSIAETQKAPILVRTGIDDRGYDIGTAPSYSYIDTQNREHAVWFEDAASLQAKLNLVAGYGVKGVIFWSVGDSDPNLFKQTP